MHKDNRTRLYCIWLGMRQRCRDPKQRYWHRYGGRGIRVCEEWQKDFYAFKNWALHNGYDDKLTLDRIDNDGNYEPSNCRFATAKEQSENSSWPIKGTGPMTQVGISIYKSELQEMETFTGESTSTRAILTLARKGLEYEKTNGR